MTTILEVTWWSWFLRGAALILFGGLTVAWPEITLAVLIALFGAFMLVDGAFALVSSLANRQQEMWGLLLIGSLLSIGLGVATFAWPQATALVLLYLIAAWAVLIGILVMVGGIRLPPGTSDKWMLAVTGFISVVFGIMLFAWPAAGALAITWLIGAYAILFGILLIALGFKVRSTIKEHGLT